MRCGSRRRWRSTAAWGCAGPGASGGPHGVQGLLRAGGVVAIGRGAGGQGGCTGNRPSTRTMEMAGVAERRQVARRGSAAVLVAAEVANAVAPVLHFPVAAHEAADLVGAGLVGAERGEAAGRLAGWPARVSRTVRSRSTRAPPCRRPWRAAQPVPLGRGRGGPPRSGGLPGGHGSCRRPPRPIAPGTRRSIAARSSWMVGWLPFTAVIAHSAPRSSIRQRARRLPGVQGVERDDAPGQAQLPGQRPRPPEFRRASRRPGPAPGPGRGRARPRPPSSASRPQPVSRRHARPCRPWQRRERPPCCRRQARNASSSVSGSRAERM